MQERNTWPSLAKQPPGESPEWAAVCRQVSESWPPDRWRNVGVVVGCSGGADSVALAVALDAISRGESLPSDQTLGQKTPSEKTLNQKTLGQNPSHAPNRGFLVLAHFHHNLRGAAADADQQLVCELADRLGCRFETETAANLNAANLNPKSDEASLRAARMAFLVRTAKATGARYITTAHSADDNAETILHQFLRGSGPAGLAGIAPTRPIDQDLVLVRPMLACRRDAIRSALIEIGQPWREDESNRDTDYQRNWIRHQLLPQIETRYPQAAAAIARAADSSRDWRRVIDGLADDWLAQHQTGNRLCVTLVRDPQTDPAVIVAAMQKLWSVMDWPRGDMTRDHWHRLAETITATVTDANRQDVAFTLPAAIKLQASGTQVTIRLPD